MASLDWLLRCLAGCTCTVPLNCFYFYCYCFITIIFSLFLLLLLLFIYFFGVRVLFLYIYSFYFILCYFFIVSLNTLESIQKVQFIHDHSNCYVYCILRLSWVRLLLTGPPLNAYLFLSGYKNCQIQWHVSFLCILDYVCCRMEIFLYIYKT